MVAADRSSIAMDVGAIASVGETGEQQPQTPTQATWPADENGWPVDEEGWPVEGYIDEQLNFVKRSKRGRERCQLELREDRAPGGGVYQPTVGRKGSIC